MPYDERQIVYSLIGDYRVDPKSNLTASFEQENLEPSNRERDKTWEYRLKLGYTNRGLADAVVLLSYEYDSRRGSDYVPNPYTAFYSAALGPVPHVPRHQYGRWIQTNGALRKFDLADRDQNIVKARLNWTAISALNAGLTLQYNGIRYPDSAYGRNGTNEQTSVSLNLDYAARGAVGNLRLLHVAEREDEPGRAAGEQLRDGNHVLFLQQRCRSTRPAPRPRARRSSALRR